MLQKIVVDASVCCKLFLKSEPYAEKALSLFKLAYTNSIQLIVPPLFIYEVTNVLRNANLSPSEENRTLKMLFNQLENAVQIVTPQVSTFSKALEISKTGHVKSGFPSFYDSSYHALAIEQNAILVTADKKHFQKTEQFKHVLLLEDFKSEMFYT